TFEGSFHDERAEPVRIAHLLLFEIGPGKDQEMIGDVGQRDPGLLAVQDVPIAFLNRRRLNRTNVASGAWLRETVTGNLVSLRLRYQVLLFLRLASPR